jgi:hypothetical protein
MTHVFTHLRHNVIAYVALFFAIGAGGGYAVAAANKKTIHGCMNRHTHALFVEKRCHRGESPVVWNQQGPQGANGRPGVSPVAAWTVVDGAGSTTGGHGITVQHMATGTYRVTATPAQCAQALVSPPMVSVSDSNPPAGHASGAFPVAWVGDAVGSTFTVTTGVVVSGAFSPADLTFNIQVPCS